MTTDAFFDPGSQEAIRRVKVSGTGREVPSEGQPLFHSDCCHTGPQWGQCAGPPVSREAGNLDYWMKFPGFKGRNISEGDR